MSGVNPYGTGPGTGPDPNVFDRSKYSLVLDENNPGQPTGTPYPGQPTGVPYQGTPGGIPYPGAPYPGQPTGMPQRGMPYQGTPYQGTPGGMPYPGAPAQGLSPNGVQLGQMSFGGSILSGFSTRGMQSPGTQNIAANGMRQEDQNISSKGIAETMNEMETLRRQINTQTFWMIFCVVAMCVLIFVLRFNRQFAAFLPFFLIAAMIGVFLAAKGGNKQKRLKALYKETFVRQLLSEHFQNVYYNWEQGMDQMMIKNSGVCRLGNRFSSEDYINAVYHGIRFQQADVKIQYHTSSGRSSHTTTYFEGRMFCFEYPTKRSHAVQVYSSNFIYPGEPASGINRRKLELESVEFNKEFKVRALDEHDAFYILTPQMMERIRAVKNKYGNITMVFDAGYLMVGINQLSMNAFDANLRKPISYPDEKARVEKDVRMIEELIQILNCIPQ